MGINTASYRNARTRPYPRPSAQAPRSFILLCTATSLLTACTWSKNEASKSGNKSRVEADLKRKYEDVDLMFSFPHENTDPDVALRDAKGLLTDAELTAVIVNATTNLSVMVEGSMVTDTLTVEKFKNAPEAVRRCVHDPSSWKVVGVRFAPYELAIPGPKEPALAWGKGNGADLAKAMQLRLALTPFCREGPTIFSRDLSMHLVYELVPEDAGQRAKFFQAQAYTKASLSGDLAGADAALKAHATYLASEEYRTFRGGIISDYATVAMARFQDKLDPKVDAEYRGKLDTLFTKRGSKVDPLKPTNLTTDITDPYLKSKSSFLQKALSGFVAKHARRTSLRGVTTMFGSSFGEGGSPWIFKSNSVAVDGSIRGNVESTMFSSFVEGASLRLVVSGKIDSAGNAFEAPGIDAKVKAAFEAQRVLVVNEDFMPGGDPEKLDFAARDAEYTKQFLRKTVDPDFNQPTSTDCGTCHLAVATNQLSGDGESLSPPLGNYNFHMLTFGKMNLRTLAEARHEASLLNAETGGYTIPAGTDLRGEDVAPAPAERAPPNPRCVTTDPSDTFALVREAGQGSKARASVNVGTPLNVLGTSATMLEVDRVAFIHESVSKCRALAGIPCGEVEVLSKSDDTIVKGADGKTYVTGANLRASAGGEVIGVGASGARFGVIKRSSPWFQIALRGNIHLSRCK